MTPSTVGPQFGRENVAIVFLHCCHGNVVLTGFDRKYLMSSVDLNVDKSFQLYCQQVLSTSWLTISVRFILGKWFYYKILIWFHLIFQKGC